MHAIKAIENAVVEQELSREEVLCVLEIIKAKLVNDAIRNFEELGWNRLIESRDNVKN